MPDLFDKPTPPDFTKPIVERFAHDPVMLAALERGKKPKGEKDGTVRAE